MNLFRLFRKRRYIVISEPPEYMARFGARVIHSEPMSLAGAWKCLETPGWCGWQRTHIIPELPNHR